MKFLFWWATQPSSHILSPRLKLPRQHRVLCLCQMQKHPLPLCMGRVMAPQCSFYHLDRASSPPRWESSWVLRGDGEKTPGSRFVKPPCVIHSLTSFTCDSFSFWAAGAHIALGFDFQGAPPQVRHLIRCRCIPICPLYDTARHQVCDPVKFMMGCINNEQELSVKFPFWYVPAQQERAKSYLISGTSSNEHVMQGTRNRFLPSPAGTTRCALSPLVALLQAEREYPPWPRLLGILSGLRWVSLECDLKRTSRINVFTQRREFSGMSGNTSMGLFIWKTCQIKSILPL